MNGGEKCSLFGQQDHTVDFDAFMPDSMRTFMRHSLIRTVEIQIQIQMPASATDQHLRNRSPSKRHRNYRRQIGEGVSATSTGVQGIGLENPPRTFLDAQKARWIPRCRRLVGSSNVQSNPD